MVPDTIDRSGVISRSVFRGPPGFATRRRLARFTLPGTLLLLALAEIGAQRLGLPFPAAIRGSPARRSGRRSCVHGPRLERRPIGTSSVTGTSTVVG